ncbi:MAG: AarF/UbiB family protein [bacterium]
MTRFVERHVIPRLRLYAALAVILRILISNRLLRLSRRWTPRERFRERGRRLNEKNAERLLRAIIRLRGLFIKVGQFLSLRVDLLPEEYTLVLSRLQDSVPPVPYDVIRTRIAEEFGKEPGELFAGFVREPIAAASLAQVHEAELHDGARAAVKILYPGIERTVAADIVILRIILNFIHIFRRRFNYSLIVNEFEKYVSMETDMIQEGKNMERMRERLGPDDGTVIPAVVWELTSKGVLTTGFVEGIKITDLNAIRNRGIDVQKVSEEVVACYMRQVFRLGFFQADPHPGNLFVVPLEGGRHRIAIVDFGLCKELPPDFVQSLGKVALAVVQRDGALMAQALIELGFETWDGKPDSIRRFCDFVVRHVDEFVYGMPRDIPVEAIYRELMEIAREKALVRIPGDFILIGRVLGLLAGLGRRLRSKIDLKEIILRQVLPGGG